MAADVRGLFQPPDTFHSGQHGGQINATPQHDVHLDRNGFLRQMVAKVSYRLPSTLS